MVRVVSLSQEERDLREKKSRLVEITKEFLGVNTSQKVTIAEIGIGISHHSSGAPGIPILISPRKI